MVDILDVINTKEAKEAVEVEIGATNGATAAAAAEVAMMEIGETMEVMVKEAKGDGTTLKIGEVKVVVAAKAVAMAAGVLIVADLEVAKEEATWATTAAGEAPEIMEVAKVVMVEEADKAVMEATEALPWMVTTTKAMVAAQCVPLEIKEEWAVAVDIALHPMAVVPAVVSVEVEVVEAV